jgi:hypothetical protein
LSDILESLGQSGNLFVLIAKEKIEELRGYGKERNLLEVKLMLWLPDVYPVIHGLSVLAKDVQEFKSSFASMRKMSERLTLGFFHELSEFIDMLEKDDRAIDLDFYKMREKVAMKLGDIQQVTEGHPTAYVAFPDLLAICPVQALNKYCSPTGYTGKKIAVDGFDYIVWINEEEFARLAELCSALEKKAQIFRVFAKEYISKHIEDKKEDSFISIYRPFAIAFREYSGIAAGKIENKTKEIE